MKRLEPTKKQEPVVISRANFDADFKFGYVAFEWNPERVVTLTDRLSGRQMQKTLLADIAYRCVRCQFDTLDQKLMDEHQLLQAHLWPYNPFESPYGNCSVVMIEGIEDYAAFLAAKENL